MQMLLGWIYNFCKGAKVSMLTVDAKVLVALVTGSLAAPLKPALR